MIPAANARLRPIGLDTEQASVIAGIWRRAWASAHPASAPLEPIELWLARVKAEFAAPGALQVMERDGQILAFMVALRSKRYVAQLFVDTHLQGQGLGRVLLDEACRQMPGGWRLHVATANGAAQRFYERYGLARGDVDLHPTTGRERVVFHWHPNR